MKALSQKQKCAAAGALAGAANGFFGAGGGMVLIPLFRRWAGVDEREAYACSVAVVLPLCAVSSAVYFFRSALPLADALPYLAGGFIGGFIGGKIFKRVPLVLLKRAFGLLILYGAARALL